MGIKLMKTMPVSEKTVSDKKKNLKALLFVCFFVSGACGLVYQVAWLRVLGLIFGNTVYATSTVLAGYMAGLGIGALFWGAWIDKKPQHSPAKVYAWLEGGVAIFAVLTPFIWKLIEIIHTLFHQTFEPSFFQFSIFKFFVALFSLFIPTFLMGGTLPVLCRFFVSHDSQHSSRSIALLYAWNTFGAVTGVLASGFFLLYAVGVWQTVLLVGLINAAIFGIVWQLEKETNSMRGSAMPEVKQEKEVSESWNFKRTILLLLFGVSGAVSMMYEVSWTRILALSLGSSIYAFSVMLATFLTGIALGSWILGLVMRKVQPTLLLFCALQLMASVFVFIGINLFDDMPFWFVKVFGWAKGSGFLLETGKFFLASLVMLPPTICIGALFTCFIEIFQKTSRVGSKVGAAYFANTIGTVLGSAFTGFFIIPHIGLHQTLMLAGCLNAGIAIIAFGLDKKNFQMKPLFVGLAVVLVTFGSFWKVEPWNQVVMTSGTIVKPAGLVGLSKNDFLNTLREKQSLFYKEGLSAVVNVDRYRDNISLAVNGKVDASTDDSFTQFFLGHLPLILHSNPQDVLVIGLGSASTLAAVASHPVKRIDAIELEPAVVEGAGYFKELNRNVLEDKRVHMVMNDGRNYVLTYPGKYDVIISEPSNPWMAGVANLFSKEHYQNMKKKLNQDGMVCQWLHAYSMSVEDLRMIVRTFTEVFPNASLWTSYYPDLMLIGTMSSEPFSFERIKKAFEIDGVKQDFKPHGIENAEGFLGNYWIGGQNLKFFSQGAKINSDNYPYLEFSAPKHLYDDTLIKNFTLLNAFRAHDFDSLVKGLEPPAEKNQKLQNAFARAFMAKRMLGEAGQAIKASNQINSDDPELKEIVGELNFISERWEEAWAALNAAAQQRPDSAKTQFRLGQLAIKQGKSDQALIYFQKAIELDPENLDYQMALGDYWFDQGKFEQSEPLYTAILKKKPNSFKALLKLSDNVFQSGTPQEKLTVSRLLIDQYPRYGPAYIRLGQFFEIQGLFPQALAIYSAYQQQFPNDSQIYLILGRVYEKLRMDKEMKQAIRQAMKLNPELKKSEPLRQALKAPLPQ